MIPFPSKKYSIIYADPPWRYNDTLGGNAKMGAMPYDTMTQEEINALPLQTITAKDAVLFMWATMPKLQEALDTIKAWGFKYKTCAFCWVKQNPKRGGGIRRTGPLGAGQRGALSPRYEGPPAPRQQERQADRRGAAWTALRKARRSARSHHRAHGRPAEDRAIRSARCSGLGLLGQRSPRE